jgi:hypothetical protein
VRLRFRSMPVKQKVLEVLARRIGVDTYSLRGEGTIVAFDEDGFLKRTRAEELIDRKVALAQYAATKQKVLEVFARRIGMDT